MRDISLVVKCLDRCCEVLREDVLSSEMTVEQLVWGVLSTFFDVIVIEDVSILFPQINASRDMPITISVRAQGYDPLPHVNLEHLDCAIEDRIACALAELFGSLNVERLVVL